MFAYDFESSYSEGKVMHGTGWRAKKNKGGGIVLDAGIHNADLLLYFLGPVEYVNGHSKIILPERNLIPMKESNHVLKKFYGHRIDEYKSDKSISKDEIDTVLCEIFRGIRIVWLEVTKMQSTVLIKIAILEI